jgi:hypothetical protein
MTGKAVDKVPSDNANLATGFINVTSPERFVIGQKVSVDDDNDSPASGYVKSIDMNVTVGGTLLIVTARGGSTGVNLSAYTAAQNAVIYGDGQQADGFTDLRSILLPSANGGSSTVYGVTKTDYPFTQAIAVSGSSITAANILSKIFDAYVTIRKKGQGKPFKVVMSYKNFGSCLTNLETAKGAFNVVPNSKKSVVYGWDEITVGGFVGALDLVAVQEMNDSEIYFLDMTSMKFATNGGFRRIVSPDGLAYTIERATTGHTYITDHVLFGDLIVTAPSRNGILFSISY